MLLVFHFIKYLLLPTDNRKKYDQIYLCTLSPFKALYFLME